MKTTAMDITSKEFKKGFRGYDIDEVDEFLDEIAEGYENIYKENSILKERIHNMEENLNHYNKMEETIQNTLILAQNAAEQSKKSAKKEADMIIKNANETAKRVLDKAHNDVVKVNDDFEKTKQEFVMFRNKFKNFMQSQLEMFEDMEKDFIKNYNIGNTINEIRLEEINLEAKDIEKENIKESLDDSNLDIAKGNEIEEVKNFFVE
ncbi:DivIVA domain-containing protein [Clostridium tetani]|nr:DivIVA domain-containing protein [Clostridium tetani]KGI37877.1 cell division protein DivIVA [Clostridium tetani]KGI39805.1 cell division protein DivIVA [Clostridium tetani ATCC 9441]KGI43832.1 cell division protein DivIVA [Clostridium tetani]KGI45400.1 cell division protein DivIVA [Clostridium tetani]KHO31704.1 cell division protein DivIVA [Clostridium tetani]